MPTRPPHPCRKAGCPHLTMGRFCVEHATLEAPAWATTRGSAHSRGYGASWRRLRQMILARDPVCTVCHRVVSTEVDHHVPKSMGGEDTMDNCRGICGDCHAKKTAAEGCEAAGRSTARPRLQP